MKLVAHFSSFSPFLLLLLLQYPALASSQQQQAASTSKNDTTESSYVVVEDGVACTHPTSCQNNTMKEVYESEILGVSCTGEMSCSDNTLKFFSVVNNSCTGIKSDEKPYGTCSMNGRAGFKTDSDGNSIYLNGTNICSGASSCSNNSWGIRGGFDGPADLFGYIPYTNLCTGKHSCSNNDFILRFDPDFLLWNSTPQLEVKDRCTGDDSCTYLQNSQFVPFDKNLTFLVTQNLAVTTRFVVGNNACTGTRSCRHAIGHGGEIDADSCTGDDSCQNWNGDVESSRFRIGNASCTGMNSCQNIHYISEDDRFRINIKTGACTGKNSCQNLTSNNVTITTGACTEDNSCQNCNLFNMTLQEGDQSCPTTSETAEGDGTSSSSGITIMMSSGLVGGTQIVMVCAMIVGSFLLI